MWISRWRGCWTGIEAARAAGLGPIKINMVVKRGVNDGSIVDMARHFHGTGIILRFIEYMDVGTHQRLAAGRCGAARPRSSSTISAALPLEPVEANYRGEVARRYRYTDGGGEIGIISSVTQPFCGDCTRARLSSEGLLYTCLFGARGHDFRALLRGGATRRGDRGACAAGLAPARRPLLRDRARADHPAPPQGGDVAHRRVRR